LYDGLESSSLTMIVYAWGREFEDRVGTQKAQEVIEKSVISPPLISHLYSLKALICESPALSFQER
jgi:hypothetical protein